MHTYRELNRVTHLLTKMYYQERIRIISQYYDPEFFYVENGNLFLTWI